MRWFTLALESVVSRSVLHPCPYRHLERDRDVDVASLLQPQYTWSRGKDTSIGRVEAQRMHKMLPLVAKESPSPYLQYISLTSIVKSGLQAPTRSCSPKYSSRQSPLRHSSWFLRLPFDSIKLHACSLTDHDSRASIRQLLQCHSPGDWAEPVQRGRVGLQFCPGHLHWLTP